MLEQTAIQTRGFHNTVDARGDVTGFQFRMSPRYYRGMWLSQFRPGDVIVDGVVYPRDEVIWEIKGVDYTPDQVLELGDTYFQVTDAATVKVRRPGGLSQGYHDVNVQYGWVCNYIAPERQHPVLGINFRGFDHTRRLLVV
jgi:hypothetical protein